MASSSSSSSSSSKTMRTFSCRHVNSFEKLDRLGEGTYGTVYRARDKATGEIVALKQVKLVLNNGFPLTSVREIKLLKSLDHPNIVKLKEVVVGAKPESIFLVFEYCEHDFAALLDRMRRRWSTSEIKCILLQLLKGLAYLHSNFILHRDLKLSNLLMNNKGVLKLADFGLARVFGNPLEPYSPKVVTLWYRAPEILMGCDKYHTAVDMWALGCIFGELLKHKPLLPGNTDLEQVELIFKLIGKPTPKIAPSREWKLFDEYVGKLPDYKYNNLRDEFPGLSDAGINLLNQLLAYDPSKRITAEKALLHPFFEEKPLAKQPDMMPTFPTAAQQAAKEAYARNKSKGKVFTRTPGQFGGQFSVSSRGSAKRVKIA